MNCGKPGCLVLLPEEAKLTPASLLAGVSEPPTPGAAVGSETTVDW
ncbi:MAG: hypothetical protein PHD30_00150 [Paludibacter sp.]|nr:hypothetical protein [Paludibacter sp.]